MEFATTANDIITRLYFDNGWTVSLKCNPMRPELGTSCVAYHDNERDKDIGPQEASDDEVAAYIAIVREGFKA